MNEGQVGTALHARCQVSPPIQTYLCKNLFIQVAEMVGKPGLFLGSETLPGSCASLEIALETLGVTVPIAELEGGRCEQRVLPPIRMKLSQGADDTFKRGGGRHGIHQMNDLGASTRLHMCGCQVLKQQVGIAALLIVRCCITRDGDGRMIWKRSEEGVEFDFSCTCLLRPSALSVALQKQG